MTLPHDFQLNFSYPRGHNQSHTFGRRRDSLNIARLVELLLVGWNQLWSKCYRIIL